MHYETLNGINTVTGMLNKKIWQKKFPRRLKQPKLFLAKNELLKRKKKMM